MSLNKEIIYNYLFACDQRAGGYTGRDIDKISRILQLNRRTIKRKIEIWSKTDPRFAKLKYIGQHFITVTLEDHNFYNQLVYILQM